MNQTQYEQDLMEFLQSGKGFFSWFQGKNTPNILDMISGQLGAIEVALKSQQLPRPVEEFAYLSGPTLADVWASMQRHLAEGWQPFEGVSVAHVNGESVYIQAVAKYKSHS